MNAALVSMEVSLPWKLFCELMTEYRGFFLNLITTTFICVHSEHLFSICFTAPTAALPSEASSTIALRAARSWLFPYKPI